MYIICCEAIFYFMLELGLNLADVKYMQYKMFFVQYCCLLIYYIVLLYYIIILYYYAT